jgi:(2Fe-2S) ferredoxin
MRNLNSTDYIGNSLSSINTNFNELEYWTNNILLSSNIYYQPLVKFYGYYGDFWKSSINFANSINAAERLTSFSTTVETNSAKFIKPIVIIYPDVFEYNDITFESNKNIVMNWFKTKYPVENKINKIANFVENSVAYVYMMFYNEVIKINNTIENNRVQVKVPVTCTTKDVSVTVQCSVSYSGNVSCGTSSNVCGAIAGSCQNTKTANCSYTNGAKTEIRTGIANIDQYFKDRSENDKLYILVMKVKGCEWEFDKFLPYYG